jgi:hypothetical protein
VWCHQRLLFLATDRNDPATIHHVMLYLGNNMIVEAPYTGVPVRTLQINWTGCRWPPGRAPPRTPPEHDAGHADGRTAASHSWLRRAAFVRPTMSVSAVNCFDRVRDVAILPHLKNHHLARKESARRRAPITAILRD